MVGMEMGNRMVALVPVHVDHHTVERADTRHALDNSRARHPTSPARPTPAATRKQGNSGLRKITRSLSPDLATSAGQDNDERYRKLVVEVEVDNLEEQIRQIRET